MATQILKSTLMNLQEIVINISGRLATQIALQFGHNGLAQQRTKGNQRFPQIAFDNFFHPQIFVERYVQL